MRINYDKGGLISPLRAKAQPQALQNPASPEKRAKVMLVFPPDWYPSEPYLSLPTLTAFLREAGHEVVQKDVNLEMYDWFFSGGLSTTSAEKGASAVRSVEEDCPRSRFNGR